MSQVNVNQTTLIMQVAAAEVGYLEKRNGNIPQLFHKTDNAGTQNWTKYWHDLLRSFQAQPWCAAWTSWCARVAGVATDVVPTMFSCTQIRNWARDRNLWHPRTTAIPQIGDHIIFSNSSGTPAHIGLVERVTDTQVHTIEGNTGAGSNTVIANGGGVFRRTYARSNTRIMGYFRPRYTNVSFPADSPFLAEGSRGTAVEEVQRLLNKHGASPRLVVDGSMGPLTRGQVDLYRRNNGLRIDGVVDVGLWGRLRGEAVPAPTPTPTPTPAPTPGGVHVVVRGDTLSAIARRYNTTVAILAELNSISNPNVISVGQRIILPGGEGTSTSSQPSSQERRVRITTERSPLRVRSGPGTNHAQVVIGIELQTVARNSTQTIVEERNNWGRLRQTFEGQPGWISLDFTTGI